MVNRVTPRVCILRCRTAQSSPLSTADFGATGEQDKDKEGEGGPDDDGGFGGNKSATVSRIASGIFRSNDEGGGVDAGAGSREGSSGDAAIAGLMLGSKGAAWREGDTIRSDLDVVDGDGDG
jgi:hypothetical protein